MHQKNHKKCGGGYPIQYVFKVAQNFKVAQKIRVSRFSTAFSHIIYCKSRKNYRIFLREQKETYFMK